MHSYTFFLFLTLHKTILLVNEFLKFRAPGTQRIISEKGRLGLNPALPAI